MQLIKSILIAFLSLLLPASAMAQAESGVVQGYTGSALFPAGNNVLLAGFKPGFSIGGGVAKTVKHSLVYNPNLEFTAASKEHYTFSLLSIHNNLKCYPWWINKVRPYAMVIGNISFMNLHQQAFTTTITPDASYYGSNPSNIPVSQITYREPDLKLQFAPTIGLGAGLGVDFTIRLKIVPFVQYSYVSYFSKSSGLINTNFRGNLKNLTTQSIMVGVRYNLFRSISK